MSRFADLLNQYIADKTYDLGDDGLAKRMNKLLGVLDPKFTIDRGVVRAWREGTARKPRKWPMQRLTALANVLKLSESETNELLNAAGQEKKIHELWLQATDEERRVLFLRQWLGHSPDKSLHEIIRKCKSNLVANENGDDNAKLLGDLALKYNQEEAISVLWEAICETTNPLVIIDHCAFTIGRIVLNTSSLTLENLCFAIFEKSVDKKSAPVMMQGEFFEDIVDKFAYTVGRVIKETQNDEVRQRACQFVAEKVFNNNLVVEDKYKNVDNSTKSLCH